MGPVQAYLDVDGIVALAKERGVDAIHPGYGFLSENPALPRACAAAGITFVGPSADLLDLLGDKTAARRLAQKAGLRVVPGTEEPVTQTDDAQSIADKIGYPLIVKAAFGGGGRGMRVVQSSQLLLSGLQEARPKREHRSETMLFFWSAISAARGTLKFKFSLTPWKCSSFA